MSVVKVKLCSTRGKHIQKSCVIVLCNLHVINCWYQLMCDLKLCPCRRRLSPRYYCWSDQNPVLILLWQGLWNDQGGEGSDRERLISSLHLPHTWFPSLGLDFQTPCWIRHLIVFELSHCGCDNDTAIITVCLSRCEFNTSCGSVFFSQCQGTGDLMSPVASMSTSHCHVNVSSPHVHVTLVLLVLVFCIVFMAVE